jgi:hypothetical protein
MTIKALPDHVAPVGAVPSSRTSVRKPSLEPSQLIAIIDDVDGDHPVDHSARAPVRCSKPCHAMPT